MPTARMSGADVARIAAIAHEIAPPLAGMLIAAMVTYGACANRCGDAESASCRRSEPTTRRSATRCSTGVRRSRRFRASTPATAVRRLGRGDRRLRSVAVGRADEDAPHGSDGGVHRCGDEAGDRRRRACRSRLKATIERASSSAPGQREADRRRFSSMRLFRQGVGWRARRSCSTAPWPNSAASIVGLEHRLRGPNMTVSHKEASGLAAIVEAVDILREGHASSLIAGGTDAVFETFYKAHDRFGVMSPVPSFSSKLAPFDAARDGIRARRRRRQLLARAVGRHSGARAAVEKSWASRRRAQSVPAERLAGSSRAARADDEAGDRGCRARAVGRSTSSTRRRTRRASSIAARRRRSRRCSAARGRWSPRSRARSANRASSGSTGMRGGVPLRPSRVPLIAGLSEPDRVDGIASTGVRGGRCAWTDRARQQFRERRRAVQRRAPHRALKCVRYTLRSLARTLDDSPGRPPWKS